MNKELTPELRKRQPKWTQFVFWAFMAIASLILFLALSAPIIIRSHKNPNKAHAISNAKQIGIALFEFDSKYGAFPSESTISLVSKEYPAHGYSLSAKSSNALLRQLIATKIVENEDIFYVPIPAAVHPDGNIDPGEALKKGEVKFAYISGLSSKSNPSSPILIAPIIPGTTKFDPKPFDGIAIVLRIDGSVGCFKIGLDGHARIGGQNNFLSAKHPVWNGKAPDIRYPE